MDTYDEYIAKKIFFKYGGSHFHMEREGEYPEYKRYKISREQEYIWIQEYQNELLFRIENDEIVGQNFNSLCMSIRQYKNFHCFNKTVRLLISRKEKLDTFSLLLLAEGILGIVDSFEKNNLGNHEDTLFAKSVSLNLLKWLLERPITIAIRYLDEDYLINLNDNQEIINRIKDELENWCEDEP